MPKQFGIDYPETPAPRYSTKRTNNNNNNRRDPVNREGTKNLLLNGWTKEGQLMYNKQMVKIRDDRHNYGVAFYKNFLNFCKI